MFYFYQFQDFMGNAQELADVAIDCAKNHHWSIDAAKINERLVRYYVTVMVLDKPSRLGRDATYQYRHLLQLMVARRMLNKGFNLLAIAENNQNASTSELAEKLVSPELEDNNAQLLIKKFKNLTPSVHKNAATSNELLKLSFKKTNEATPAKPALSLPYQALQASSQSKVRPPMAIQDVLEEVKRLKRECMREMAYVQQLPHQLQQLIQAQHQTKRWLQEKSIAIEERLKNLDPHANKQDELSQQEIHHLLFSHIEQSNAQFALLNKQLNQLEQKMQALLEQK